MRRGCVTSFRQGARPQQESSTVGDRRSNGRVDGQVWGSSVLGPENSGKNRCAYTKLVRRSFPLALVLVCSAKATARYVLRPSSPLVGQPSILDASPTSCSIEPCSFLWSTVARSATGRG
jgi:hypothetical protein